MRFLIAACLGAWLGVERHAVFASDGARPVELEALIEGMAPREDTGEGEVLEGWVPGPDWTAYTWGIGLMQGALASLGLGLGVTAWYRRRPKQGAWEEAWSGLAHFLETGQARPTTFEEWQRIQLLAAAELPTPKRAPHPDWARLSPTEKSVAIGLLQHKTMAEIADELSCTPSYIYNIRSSIRRKWAIEGTEQLLKAIGERIDGMQAE